ncbi:ribonuclease HII [Candidatus Curtissbacteria bacterium RIFCSPHIGHO2_12_FULL_38_9b]|uniref:Ribonuclease HII n=1 Tax=Candidatus Curtissbacteria bacterium RIFCSPHIGHO2_12_FULL_38_9b TaxID=1797720 RepID=A0A1F5GY71_9BACT|nr:MAG: ribonuclease HII [Candidatus Curtissbacteria bacterium RIFCSPHIGHO2_12_FULL_38_9b]
MTAPDFSIESSFWQKGYQSLAGIDEVGRGSWAGPVVAAAVILPLDFEIPKNFGDSKQIKPHLRKRFDKLIKDKSIGYSIAKISVAKINKLGIGNASQMAFRKCLKELIVKPDYILVDAFYIKHVNRKNQMAIIKGDEKSVTIAAASIIAKVYRDNLMKKLSRIYKSYGFAKNKGYGTKFHKEAIKTRGFSKIHRTSFKLKFLDNE